MTEEEKLQFSGTLCMAARRMGIKARLTEMSSGYSMIWIDPPTAISINSPLANDKKEAVFQGCLALQNYLRL